MARVFNIFEFDFDLIIKSFRQLISILAWSWAILIFILGYFARGHYNHVNNNDDLAPPPLFTSVFVPVLKVLVVAPSAFGLPTQSGSAGYHEAVQSGQLLSQRDESSQLTPYSAEGFNKRQQWVGQQPQQERAEGQLCAGCLPPGQAQQIFPQQQQQQQQQQRSQGQPGLVPLGVNRNHNDGAGFSYSVQLEPQKFMQMQMQHQIQQQQEQQWGNQPIMPQQRAGEGALCAGCSSPLNWQQQVGQQGMQQGQIGGGNYGYSVQLTQPPSNFGQQLKWAQQQKQQEQQQRQQFQQDPAAVQHLEINDNGQYSFGYNAADSSRQEQRSMDGIVTGNYGYTDPSGRQVQVEYRAGPHEGYHAFGDNIPPQNQLTQQLPLPVQDTPEVQAARAQFFQAYDQQLKRVQQEQEANAAARTLLEKQQNQSASGNEKIVSVYSETTQPENQSVGTTDEDNDAVVKTSLASASDFKNLPEPIAVPDTNTLSHSEIEDDDEFENDAVVISSDDSVPPATITRKTQQAQAVPVNNQGASYQISHVVGADVKSGGQSQQVQGQGFNLPLGFRGGEGVVGQGGQFQQVGQQQQGQAGDKMRSSLPGYFYYVSVGGTPHYVTSSNLLRSDFPTSVKATLVGALPIAAVHDTQVSQQQSGGTQAQVKSSPPLYLDFDNKAQAGLQLNNMNLQQQSTHQMHQQSQNPFVLGFIPGALVSFRNDAPQTQQGMNQEVPKGQTQTLGQIPVVGYPILYSFKK